MKDDEILECYKLFKKQTENGLKIVLSQVPGEKIIIIDKSLKHIVDVSYGFIFREKDQHDIKKFKYFDQLGSLSTDDSNKTCVFFVPSCPKIFKKICLQVASETNHERKCSRKYVILVVNALSNVCENMLEEYGCYGRVEVHEVPLSLMPLDTDLYSSEQLNYLPTLFLHKDKTPLRSMVKGILQLESQFGRPNQIACVGQNAIKFKQLRKILLDYDKDHNNSQKFELQNEKQKTYDKLIIFDREVDYITPLVTADTVESMIDDTFKINAGTVKINKEVVGKDKDVTFRCSNEDSVFKIFRDYHVTQAITDLPKTINRITETQDKIKSTQDTELMALYLDSSQGVSHLNQDKYKKDIATQLFQMVEHMQQLRDGAMNNKEDEERDFENNFMMKHYPKLISRPTAYERRQLQSHILVNYKESKDLIINLISEFMLRQVSPLEILKFLCLFSVISSGLNSKDYESLKNKFIANYGIKWLTTWFNLKKLGLLFIRKATNIITAASSSASSRTASDLFQSVISQIEAGSYQKLIEKFNLVPTDDDYQDKLSRTTAGVYVPLSAKIIEQLLVNKEFDEKTKNCIVGGVSVSGSIASSAKGKTLTKNNKDGKKMAVASRNSTQQESLVLLYVLGGITYSEISVLRLLGRKLNCKFIFCTDSVLNGDRMLSQFLTTS